MTPPVSSVQNLARVLVLLCVALAFAGVGHLTFLRQPFQAQVRGTNDPVQSARHAGLALAALFMVVLSGNLSQALTHADAFGLETHHKCQSRLSLQPVMVAWTLWRTGVWAAPKMRRQQGMREQIRPGLPD